VVPTIVIVMASGWYYCNVKAFMNLTVVVQDRIS